MKLAELEHYFASAATSGSGPLPGLDRVFLGSEHLSATDRVAIYNRGYFYRLLEALASVFTQTKRLLGDSDFERLGLAYLAQHPSEHPAVERVGRSFCEFLRGVGAEATAVDLASFEWARLSALVAPNPKTVASAHSIDPSRFPRARLGFVPSLHWLELDPHALSAFAGEHPTPAGRSEIGPPRSPCAVVVWRSQHVVEHRVLDAPEWAALLSATSGATLSRVCTAFDSGSEAEDVRRAFKALSAWFARQWLETVAYDDE